MSYIKLYSKAQNIVDAIVWENQALAKDLSLALREELKDWELKANDNEWDLVNLQILDWKIVYTQRWTITEWNDALKIEINDQNDQVTYEKYKIDAVTGKRYDV